MSVGVGIRRVREVELEGQEPFRLEAGFDGIERVETPDHEPRPDGEDEGQRRFRDHEERAEASLSRR